METKRKITCGSNVLNSMNTEQIKTENNDVGRRVGETFDTKGEECSVKIEDMETDSYGDEKFFKDKESLQLTEELDIKPDINASTDVTARIASEMVPKKRQGVIDQTSLLKVFSCYKCNFVCLQMTDMSRHMDSHLKNPIRKVPFITRITDDNYIIKDHDYLKEFPHEMWSSGHVRCLKCNSTYRNKIWLDDHIIKTHPEYTKTISSALMKCRDCPYQTTIQGNLSRHTLTHASKHRSPEHVSCSLCNLIYKSKFWLDDHIIKNHPTLIGTITCKIYDCTNCKFRTTISTKLSKHMGKHSARHKQGSKDVLQNT
ncbi:unnamed protein product [Acanthoscelides obtectus]|uniref:C2H2-type domain-containing protein n=1 Tax=Acanthoscelides obtectus TaxID=200917 RepID=A0A9P0PB74_ACAOB|nr:unnamed protein product [Acanthoscelides obtectus]CAK1675590.1 hypothetical protein AOBTE_LOCUS30311 [Acanthoscelides obtectus]